jgi:predicted O-linked N-acetylglucosamine transferase (SPINDLY family)
VANTPVDKIREAAERFHARDLAGAERLCLEILREAPRHADAMHMLGVLRLAQGEAGRAISLIDQALRESPRDAAMAENLGVAHLAARNFAIAESSFRQAMTLGGSHALLYTRLGIALASQGKLDEAISALRRAASMSPDVPEVHLNLGNVLAERNRLDEALASFKAVLALQPDSLVAHFNVGNLHRMAGRLEDAAASYGKVLALEPRDADTHSNLGIVYEQQRRLTEAERCYRQALALAPNHVHALNNLGNVLHAQGRLDEAAAACEKALALKPDFVSALLNLGDVRSDQGQFQAAQSLYERVLRLDGRNAEAHHNLGKLFMARGRVKDAMAAYRRSLEFAPGRAAVLNDLGSALRDSGDFDGAVAAYRDATAAEPGFVPALYNLAETFKVRGALDEAAACYERALSREARHPQALSGLVHARQHMCDWEGFQALWERLRAEVGATLDGQISPFSVLSLPTTPKEQLDCAIAWSRRHLDPVAATRPALGFDFSGRRRRDRLRIGYLAWGLHDHATGYWTPELFELHDRSRCEVTAYAYGPDDGSEIRKRIRGAAEHFVDLAREPDGVAARRIYDDGVDVLVDLTGYTFGTRSQLLALRPAPVQVNWFYPGTMGTTCADYFIADPFVVPHELEPFFTESIARLPDCYMITDRKRPVSEAVPSRAECGIPDDAFVFCYFNQTYKILPDIFASWMRILRAVPGSVLWFLESNPWATANLGKEAEKHGVASQRIIVAPRKPIAEHLVRYRVADLALDSFPYTSHTTAADALWVGCPLVTRVGDTFASRVAASVLICGGAPELVTDTVDSFERLAVELATSPAKLRETRRRLEEARATSRLFDTPRFVRNLESAYENMFKAFLARGPGSR